MPVRDGMVVDTKDATAQRVAKGVVELVMSDYPEGALEREDDRNELRDVARHFGLEKSRYHGERHAYAKDDRHPYIKMDLNECIVCGRCVRACDGPGDVRAPMPTRLGHEDRAKRFVLRGQRVRVPAARAVDCLTERSTRTRSGEGDHRPDGHDLRTAASGARSRFTSRRQVSRSTRR
jgi:predicted molibdopterin-dependent oxidoreductase YjgC